MQGGSEQDGKDVFEESFLVFERQVRTGHFRGESSLETYFHGIARWQWLTSAEKTSRQLTLKTNPIFRANNEFHQKILISEERRVILSGLIAQVGERCQKLLGLFQLNYSMREISELSGYSSEQVAANEVHGCQKLKKIIHQHPETLDALKYRT